MPYNTVRDNVKYPRLIPELKEMVDEGTVDVHAAVKAQDAATDQNREVNAKDAVTLAQEMRIMSGVQRKRLSKPAKTIPRGRWKM